MKPGMKYNVVARIQGRRENLEAKDPHTWLKCGIATVRSDGQVAIKLNGLPLPSVNWDGWLYIREEIIANYNVTNTSNRNKKQAHSNKSFNKDYDDDIPF